MKDLFDLFSDEDYSRIRRYDEYTGVVSTDDVVDQDIEDLTEIEIPEEGDYNED